MEGVAFLWELERDHVDECALSLGLHPQNPEQPGEFLEGPDEFNQFLPGDRADFDGDLIGQVDIGIFKGEGLVSVDELWQFSHRAFRRHHVVVEERCAQAVGQLGNGPLEFLQLRRGGDAGGDPPLFEFTGELLQGPLIGRDVVDGCPGGHNLPSGPEFKLLELLHQGVGIRLVRFEGDG
jgi:hypothetical protein